MKEHGIRGEKKKKCKYNESLTKGLEHKFLQRARGLESLKHSGPLPSEARVKRGVQSSPCGAAVSDF